jgi:hypothetical protein
MAQPPLPTHLYFRCEDEPKNLLMVDSALFDAGNVSGWFSAVFGNVYRRPAPVEIHAGDNFPVFYLPMPRGVLVELVRAMRFPTLTADMERHVPQSLQRSLSLAAWKNYVEYYGFVKAPLQKPKITPDALRQKAIAKLNEAAALPEFTYVRRVAEALVNAIKAGHPKINDYNSGATKVLKCEFISRYKQQALDLTFLLTVLGDPIITPIPIGWYLIFKLKEDGFYFSYTRPGKEYFRYCVEIALGHALARLDVFAEMKRNTKRKTLFVTEYWPAGTQALPPGDYELCLLALERAQGIRPAGQTLIDRIMRELKRTEAHADEDDSAVPDFGLHDSDSVDSDADGESVEQ